MSLFWPALLGAVVAALVVTGLMVWWRYRSLLRTPGTFRAAERRPGESGGRVAVIGRYNDVGLELMTAVSIDPRPRWSAARHRVQIHREGQGSRTGTVLARLEGGGTPVRLELSAEVCSGLSTWIEAGPAGGFGTWREDPWRGGRRRPGRH